MPRREALLLKFHSWRHQDSAALSIVAFQAGGDKMRLEKYKEEREGKNRGVAKHIEYTILLFVHFFGNMEY